MNQWLWCVVLGCVLLWAAPVQAQETADFLGAEGAPANIAKTLTKNMRKAIGKRKQFKLLPQNPMDISMARLTLGCIGDTPDCMNKIGTMRQARWLFHIRIFPAGSRVRALFRQIDAQTGKNFKEVVHLFKKNQAKSAHTELANKLFGDAPAPKRTVAKADDAVKKAADEAAKKAADDEAAKKAAADTDAIKKTADAEAAKKAADAEAAKKAADAEAAKKAADAEAAKKAADAEAAKKAADAEAAKKAADAEAEKKKKLALAQAATKKEPTVPLVQDPRFWGWIAVGVAVASVAGVIGFGVDASNKQSDVSQKLQASQTTPINYKKDIQPIEDSGRTSAIMANVFIGIAAAAAITGGVLFIIKRPTPAAEATPTTSQQPQTHPTFVQGGTSLLHVAR